MINFKDRLKKLRKEKRLTQEQLASQIGIGNTQISFYEKGERQPTIQVIIKLASVFHVSSDYLLGIDAKESVDISELSNLDQVLVKNLIERLKEK